MKFAEFAEYLQKLEKTSKRLEITDILADLIGKLGKDEIDIALYLSLGYLKAPFENEKFNMAEKMMIRAVALAYEKPEEEVKKLYSEKGDLGDVCIAINKNNKSSSINIVQTHARLLEIAVFEGSGSQDKKISVLAALLKETDAQSSKFIVRIVLGITRLGFTELTIIDALSQHLTESKELRKQIEDVYNIHPDIGLIAKRLKQKGIKGLDDIEIETGVPILAQKAQRIGSVKEIIEKMQKVWAEYKFDGTRVQLHLDRDKTIETSELEQQNLFESQEKRMFVKTFTRNLEETSYMYPDIVEAAIKQVDAKSVILDGEAIGYDKKTGEFLPFQEIMQRKRKYDVKETAKLVPLKYFVFDILYYNGKPLTKKSLRERRDVLNKIIKKGNVLFIDNHLETSTESELTKYFEEARDKGLEGLIVKKPDAEYMAGARSFTWVKYKVADDKLLEDTLDCVVLGYYFGRGVRSQFGIGGFLVGIYDEKEQIFRTLTKVGTGLKDEDWVYLKSNADKIKINEKPNSVELNKIYEPDVWLEPKLVVELGGDEISKSSTHSAGYALRFPRLIKFREDKKATDATTIKEVETLHKMQKRGYI